MATTPPSSSSSCGPKLESLTHVDITKLSQSELHALSECSNSAFDVHRTDDVVIPNIDRSVFSESASSRRQTYSRLREKHHHHHQLHPRTRLPRLLLGPKLSPAFDLENHSIIHYLKHYLEHNSTSNCPPPPPPPPLPPPPPPPPPVSQLVVPGDGQQELGLGLALQEKMALAVHVVEKKRKRSQMAKWNPMLLENGVGIELLKVNKSGEEVDFAALGSNGDELYSGELGRRTIGLKTEEAVLEFLRGLEGEWCSRRKKRKYVDASIFGDALPIGWKLLLALRRREAHVWVYCRRIISPTGEQFLSCKEASSFLHSYFEVKSQDQPMDQEKSIVEQASGLVSGSSAGFVHNPDNTSHEIGSGSSVTHVTASGAHENEFCLVDIDNLPDVQVQDLFECYKCNLSFDQKNAYLQHLMSFHQQTTRRYKFGETVGDGVIVKDGKFECQFCHKVFLERRSYNGHVGVHVRNHFKGSEELPAPDSVQKSTGSPLQEGLFPRTSKMNELADIAQNSILGTPSAGLSSTTVDISCPIVMNLDETLAGSTDPGATLGSDSTQFDDLKADRTLDQDLNQHGSEYIVADGGLLKSDDRQTFEFNLKETCINDAELSDATELKRFSDNDIEIGFGTKSYKLSEDVAGSKAPTGEENVLQNGITSSPTRLVQSLEYFSSVSDKGENDIFLDGRKLENLTSFDELDLDEMETFKYGFADGQESSSLPGVTMDLETDTGLGGGLNASVGFDSKAVVLTTTGPQQFTTVCVWCRSEFKVEAFDSEMQSDSIGFMCTTCKDNISGHFDKICR